MECIIFEGTGEVESSLEEDTPLYIDEDTGLMWSRSSGYMTWDEAFEYAEDCADGGYTDWRLPTRSELITLIDDTRCNPACKDGLMKSAGYWSSTPYADSASDAWIVYFSYGHVYGYDKSYHCYVRCVRTVQPT